MTWLREHLDLVGWTAVAVGLAVVLVFFGDEQIGCSVHIESHPTTTGGEP